MKSTPAFLQRHVLPAIVCFGVALAVMQTRLFQDVENLTLDARTQFRGRLETAVPADELALMGIDDTSLRRFGRWPWNREVHGDLLQQLAFVRPAVVAWDILFTEPAPEDDYLVSGIVRNRAVVLGAARVEDAEDGLTLAAAAAAGLRLEPLTRITGDRTQIPGCPALLAPTGRLGQAAGIGFVDTPPGPDGVRREAPLLVRVDDQVYPTLGLKTLLAYWGASAADVTVNLGDTIIIDAPLAHRRIPISASGGYTINYRHDLSGFIRYNYSEVLWQLKKRYDEKQPVALPPLTGRMLLVGQVADGLADFGPSPFSPLTPLMLVHANVIENILREDYVRHPGAAWIWLGALAIGVCGLARFSDRTPLAQASFAVGVPLAFVVAATLLWINGSWQVPIVGPLLGFVLVQGFMVGRRMLNERRAKEQIKGMFGTYVSPELVERLVAAGAPPQLGGHQEEITAYFSDIQNFSTFSEILPPDRLVELMNEYLTACTDIVQAEGGTLDKYIGDAVVAMFGAPVTLRDHAYRACVTVVRTQERLGELRAKWRADGTWPDIVCRMRSRIGLNSGVCVIGNMGSRTRFNYTMMGDNVNLAARMESGAKAWGTYAMCTEAARAACEAQAPGRIVFRPLGRIQVKGRVTAVPIHEIAGRSETYPESGREAIELFSQGVERFFSRDWEGARELFERSAKLELLVPGRDEGVATNPSLVYLQWVENFRNTPPPSGWDGVIAMKEK